MYISSLSLKNFRNHSSIDLHFKENLNLIQGRNGSGKTSIIEAINIVSTTKSFRALREIDVIGHLKDFSTIKLENIVNSETISEKIIYEKISNSRVKKTFEIDGLKRKAKDFIGKNYTVLFTTDLINNFTDKSSTRRKFFNQILSQIDTSYFYELNYLEKIIKNKLKLLNLIYEGRDSVELKFWNEELAKYSARLIVKRNSFIKSITSYLQEKHIKIEGKVVSINYLSKSKLKDPFREEQTIYDLTSDIQTLGSREIASGRCLVGAQRDDYEVFFNNCDIRNFASRGEQKFSIAVLLYTIAKYIESIKNESPIILLDDLNAEMDTTNMQKILKLIKNSSYQAIITAIDTKNYEGFFNNHIKL